MFERFEFFVKSQFPDIISDDEINSDTNLFLLGLSSLKMMKLVNFIEKNYKVKVPENLINSDQMKSINSIKNLIKKLIKYNSVE